MIATRRRPRNNFVQPDPADLSSMSLSYAKHPNLHHNSRCDTGQNRRFNHGAPNRVAEQRVLCPKLESEDEREYRGKLGYQQPVFHILPFP